MENVGIFYDTLECCNVICYILKYCLWSFYIFFPF
jgi:hypothetical protein